LGKLAALAQRLCTIAALEGDAWNWPYTPAWWVLVWMVGGAMEGAKNGKLYRTNVRMSK
jgi:hypothetical protein